MESDDSDDGNRCFFGLNSFFRMCSKFKYIYRAYLRSFLERGYAFLCFEEMRI